MTIAATMTTQGPHAGPRHPAAARPSPDRDARGRKARRSMPYRIMQLSYYPAIVSAGLILGAGGAVVQVSQEVSAGQSAPIRAAYDAPTVSEAPAAAPYAGTAVALAGTSMAVLAVVGKGVMDLIFGYKERQRTATDKLIDSLNGQIDNLNDQISRLRQAGLDADRAHGDALGQVASLRRQMDQISADNQRLLEMLREQGQDIISSVQHVGKTVRNQGTIGVKVAKAVVKQLGGSESDFDAATIPDPTPIPDNPGES